MIGKPVFKYKLSITKLLISNSDIGLKKYNKLCCKNYLYILGMY